MSIPWWKHIDVKDCTLKHLGLNNMAMAVFTEQAVENEEEVYSATGYGTSVHGNQYVLDNLREMGGRSIYVQLHGNSYVTENTFVWKNAVVTWQFGGTYHSSAQIVSTDMNLAEKLRAFFAEELVPRVENRVYSFMKEDGRLILEEIEGEAGNAIVRDNYSAEVIGAYDHIVADLNAKDPCGRVVIVDGPPGTGKSFLVRGLVTAVPKAMFVLVPSHMVVDMMSPELLPAIIHQRNANGPMVFVLEDADACLAPRKADNMSAISSLLNLGDGIFGSIFDIRIVATTNTRVKDIDEAILRPGRLCSRVNVDKLSVKEANAVYSRLVGKRGEFTTEKTLAEVYKEAKKR